MWASWWWAPVWALGSVVVIGLVAVWRKARRRRRQALAARLMAGCVARDAVAVEEGRARLLAEIQAIQWAQREEWAQRRLEREERAWAVIAEAEAVLTEAWGWVRLEEEAGLVGDPCDDEEGGT
ncbi:hypothetical protein [Streptomyces chilikensis]|uniref:Uncharacterized protein n=1 Tax=Streptomyces chilikensis TaxID=1194079 RepID=A0ABV3ERL0_9ACTN